MKVIFSFGVGLNGCRRKETVELDDDLTDEEIEEEFQNWTRNFVDAAWRKEGE